MSWIPIVLAILELIAQLIGLWRERKPLPPVAPMVQRLFDAKRTELEQASCYRLLSGRSVCSCTAIWSDGKRTLLVSCNHCLTNERNRDGSIPRAAYPLPAQVETLDGKVRYAAVVFDGSGTPDLALIVVDKPLEWSPLTNAFAPAGETVWHYGVSSKTTSGVLLPYEKIVRPAPYWLQSSTCRSIPGDSGAAVFAGNGIVAVNWGRTGGGLQLGTPAPYVRSLIQTSAFVKDEWPECAAYFRDPVPDSPAPAAPPGDVKPPPVNPPVPPMAPPPRERFLRRLLWWRR